MNARLVAVVVGKLRKWQELIPRTPEIHNTGAKHILQYLNSALKLSVRLGMKYCAQLNLRAQLTLYFPLEVRGKLRTSIINNRRGHTVKMDYLTDVDLSQPL